MYVHHKGLSDGLRSFSTVVTQKTADLKFSEFKASLRSYEEYEKCRVIYSNNERVMKMASKNHQNDLNCLYIRVDVD